MVPVWKPSCIVWQSQDRISEEILMKNFIFGTVSVRPITHMISEITTLSSNLI